mgnify:CR=1 FL=1
MVLPLVIVGNLFDRLVIVIRVLRQKSGILLVSDEKSEPHDEVDEDEDVNAFWKCAALSLSPLVRVMKI